MLHLAIPNLATITLLVSGIVHTPADDDAASEFVS